MSTGQRNDARAGSFIANGALTANQLVRMDAGVDRTVELVPTGATAGGQAGIGCVRAAAGDTEEVGVFLLSKEGTMVGIADETLSAGDQLTGPVTTAGALSIAATTNKLVGVALEGAAAGDFFEFMPKTGSAI